MNPHGDLGALALALVDHLEKVTTQGWELARPMILCSVAWFSISVASAYAVALDESFYGFGDMQPLYQSFVIAAAYFAHYSLKGLREFNVFNSELRSKTIDVLEENFIGELEAQADGPSDAFLKNCTLMGAVRPLLESRVQGLSLQLPANVSGTTLRNAIIAILTPIIVIDIVPAHLLAIAKIAFPPLRVLDPLQNSGLSLFG
jgi:hypothetical protein